MLCQLIYLNGLCPISRARDTVSENFNIEVASLNNDTSAKSTLVLDVV